MSASRSRARVALCAAAPSGLSASGFLKSAATLTNRSGEGASCCALWATSSKHAHEDLRPSWGVATDRHGRMQPSYARRRALSSGPTTAGQQQQPHQRPDLSRPDLSCPFGDVPVGDLRCSQLLFPVDHSQLHEEPRLWSAQRTNMLIYLLSRPSARVSAVSSRMSP